MTEESPELQRELPRALGVTLICREDIQHSKALTSPQEVFLLLGQLQDSHDGNHEAVLAVLCEIDHQLLKPFLGERGNQVIVVSPERIFLLVQIK